MGTRRLIHSGKTKKRAPSPQAKRQRARRKAADRMVDRANKEMDRKTGGIRVVPLPDPETAGAFVMPCGQYAGLTLAEIVSGTPGRPADPGYIRWVADKRVRFRSADAVRAACGILRALDQPTRGGSGNSNENPGPCVHTQ